MPEEPLRNKDGRHRRARGRIALRAFHPYLPADEADGSIDAIRTRLARGPVPLHLLVIAARRCGFEGLSILEETTAAAGADVSSLSGAVQFGESPGEPALHDPAIPRIGLDDAFERIFELLGERRPGQLEMARLVEETLGGGGVALIEAGTGIGKSLAYLVPSLLVSRATGERVIVSTHTKNLQEQLLTREAPLARDILGTDFRTARLVGRESYLCAKRLVSLIASLLDEDPAAALAWGLASSLSREGTVDELPAVAGQRFRGRVRAPDRCEMNRCAHADRCPLVIARQRAREAELLVVNHALLLTDHRQEGSIIGPYRRVIIDEAHHLERCVMENLSIAAPRDEVSRILDPVRPLSRRDDRWRLLREGAASGGDDTDGGTGTRDIGEAMLSLSDRYAALFTAIESISVRDALASRGKTRFVDGAASFPDAGVLLNDYFHIYNCLKMLLKPLLDISAPPDARSFQQELAFCLENLDSLGDSLAYLMRGDDETAVFWLEWMKDGRLQAICASPLSVDRLFADYLEERCDAVVLTSATLAQSGSFAFLRERLGLALLHRGSTELIVPSPFDYESGCLILLHTGLGDPNNDVYAAALADVVAGLARAVRRRMLVLCTSYRLTIGTARHLERRLPGQLLVQGDGRGREALSEELRRSEAGVLLGVASFWEGVDFPGDELELLVIPKLPFPVPTEPIVEARSEQLRALGEDPFERLFLPEAVLRMRQGIGRLIRRAEDRGVVVLLDERIEQRPYGAEIAANLPAPLMHVEDVDELVDAARRWFDDPQPARVFPLPRR